MNDADIVQELLRAGADVNVHDSTMETSLHVAARVGSQQIIESLLHAGADVNAQMVAYRLGDHRSTVCVPDSGNTPLTLAVKKNRIGILTLLLTAGADKSKIVIYEDAGDGISSPSFYASQYQYDYVVLVNGRPLELHSEKRGTALDIAKEQGFSEIVELLSQ